MTPAGAFIPWSGQGACFDSSGRVTPCVGTGQDAEVRPGVVWPELRFAPAAPGVVRDALTGLHWPVDASAARWPMAWDEAAAWVDDANRSALLGHDDWRLPSRRELLYLTCPARARPALPDAHPFRNIFQHWHWTATPFAASGASGDSAWRVHLEGGRMFPGPKSAAHMVLPVRGASAILPETPELAAAGGTPWPDPRFEVSDGQALDRLTGLAWLTRALPVEGTASWQEALDAARRLGGPWRLPSILELESLVDASRAWPALPDGQPFASDLDGVWSATSSGFDTSWAWVLYFGKGAVGVGHKPGRHFKFLLTRTT